MPSVSTFPHPRPAARTALPSVPGYSPLRCVGEAFLPSQLAVDLAQVLDVDADVERWSCRCAGGRDGQRSVMFEVHRAGKIESLLVGAVEDTRTEVSPPLGLSGSPPLRCVTNGDIDPVRLANARLLLPHAGWRVSLDDRVRLLAVLDEEGSITLGECLSVFRHTSRPIVAVASLALARVVDIDLDMPLGARTRVIRRPD